MPRCQVVLSYMTTVVHHVDAVDDDDALSQVEKLELDERQAIENLDLWEDEVRRIDEVEVVKLSTDDEGGTCGN